jgi:hypothetical protein
LTSIPALLKSLKIRALDMDLTGSVDTDPGKPNCPTNKRKIKKLHVLKR